MAPCPGARRALEPLRDRPYIPFGVHLTLVSDFATYRWDPVAPAEKVVPCSTAMAAFSRRLIRRTRAGRSG